MAPRSDLARDLGRCDARDGLLLRLWHRWYSGGCGDHHGGSTIDLLDDAADTDHDHDVARDHEGHH
jgi:hypothetical protein